jgi:hypothetical protein
MRFTERELTVAVDELAQQVFGAGRSRWKRKGLEEAWLALPPMEKYGHRTAVADTVLPVLIALPERPTVGAPPEFSEVEWSQAGDAGIRQSMDRDPGSYDALGDAERSLIVNGAIQLARAAIGVMPIRQDPDAIVIPDHL